jgi:hypothetical protein
MASAANVYLGRRFLTGLVVTIRRFIGKGRSQRRGNLRLAICYTSTIAAFDNANYLLHKESSPQSPHYSGKKHAVVTTCPTFGHDCNYYYYYYYTGICMAHY